MPRKTTSTIPGHEFRMPIPGCGRRASNNNAFGEAVAVTLFAIQLVASSSTPLLSGCSAHAHRTGGHMLYYSTEIPTSLIRQIRDVNMVDHFGREMNYKHINLLFVKAKNRQTWVFHHCDSRSAQRTSIALQSNLCTYPVTKNTDGAYSIKISHVTCVVF